MKWSQSQLEEVNVNIQNLLLCYLLAKEKRKGSSPEHNRSQMAISNSLAHQKAIRDHGKVCFLSSCSLLRENSAMTSKKTARPSNHHECSVALWSQHLCRMKKTQGLVALCGFPHTALLSLQTLLGFLSLHFCPLM